MSVVKKKKIPSKHFFLFLGLHTKYNGQLIAPDLHLAFQNPTLLNVKGWMLQTKLFEKLCCRKQKQKQNRTKYPQTTAFTKRKIHEPPLIMLYSEFSSPFFLSLPSGAPLRLPVDSAKH